MTVWKRNLLGCALCLAASSFFSYKAYAALPDARLYTTYSFPNDLSMVYAMTCGSVATSEGCFKFGELGPFGHVGALMEGYATSSGNVVNRNIYIVDVAAGADANQVVLYRYKKTDLVTDSFDTVTYMLTRKMQLPLVGGRDVFCAMAGNADYVVIGTGSKSVRVTKGNLEIFDLGGGGSDNPPLIAITADDYGYISVSYGFDSTSASLQLAPDGSFVSDGGGSAYMITSKSGLSTRGLATPDTDVAAARLRVGVVTNLITARP